MISFCQLIDRVVVATDLSAHAWASYDHAALMARALGADVTLLHVDELLSGGFRSHASFAEYVEQIQPLRDAAASRAMEHFNARGIDVVTRVAEGRPDEQILERADQRVMLVLSHQPRSALDRLLHASTTDNVIEAASCPVLVVPPAAAPGARQAAGYSSILATTDFSRESALGALVALQLAERFEVPLALLHVVTLPHQMPTLPGENIVVNPDELMRRQRDDADARLARWVAALDSPRVTPVIELGPTVADAIALRVAQDEPGSKLAIVSSHGSRIFGSVARAVVERAAGPILVLPRPFLERQNSGHRLVRDGLDDEKEKGSFDAAPVL